MENFQQILLRLTRFALLSLVIPGMLLTACGKPKQKKDTPEGEEQVAANVAETPTSGVMQVGFDESLRPIMRQIIKSFELNYPKAKIIPVYKPEGELIMDLGNDSLRLIFIGRELSEAEEKPIRAAKIEPRTSLIGKDAIAVIVNPKNPLQNLSEEQLGKIMRGDIRTWKGVDEKGTDEEINVVFDDPQSGLVRALQKRYLEEGDSLSPNAFSAGSHDAVIDYVEQAPNAIGFLGVAWVSDRDHPKVREYLGRISLARMLTPDTSDLPGVYVQPYQNEIILDRYPLTRRIYACSREHYTGLGTGFVAFAAGELGQRILLKAGLVPEYMPPRFIILPEEDKE
ncbi:MAG: substrate-binding domain-containing protein [Bacteroidota bacterium]